MLLMCWCVQVCFFGVCFCAHVVYTCLKVCCVCMHPLRVLLHAFCCINVSICVCMYVLKSDVMIGWYVHAYWCIQVGVFMHAFFCHALQDTCTPSLQY